MSMHEAKIILGKGGGGSEGYQFQCLPVWRGGGGVGSEDYV